MSSIGKRETFQDILFLFIISLRVFFWFPQPYTLMQGDTTWSLAFQPTLSTWDPRVNGGYPNIQPLEDFVTPYFLNLLRLIGLNETDVIKMFVMFSLFFLSLSCYFLAREMYCGC